MQVLQLSHSREMGLRSEGGPPSQKIFDEPLGKDEKTIRRENLQKMFQDYYALRGWNLEAIPE
jgi:aldehyde:ferredoxin oxidoreductase